MTRSKRQRDPRSILAIWAALLIAGIMLVALGGDRADQRLMPGPVAAAHSFVADCSSCHSNIGDGPFGWVHAILKASDSRADNKLCLSCHSLGEAAHRPHGLARSKLEKLTSQHRPASIPAGRTSADGDVAPLIAAASAWLGETSKAAAGSSHDEISCAVCHREHRGAVSLTATAAGRTCSTCHQSRFESFQNGHPDFGAYPFGGPSLIAFDHTKHFTRNFAEATSKRTDLKPPPAKCTDCHFTSADGRDMRVKPFAETCSACHLPQILGADRVTGPKGLALLTLPALDLETLSERKAAIGEWPDESDADLSPMMRVLLARDDERRALLAAIEKLDLRDLTTATDRDLAAVTALVWEIKGLFHELTTSNASNLLRRVQAATSGRVGREQMIGLLGTLPRDVLIAARNEWLPALATEIARREKPGWEKALRARTSETGSQSGNDSAELEELPATPPQTKLVAKGGGGRFYVSVLGEIVQEGLEAAETVRVARGETKQPTGVPAAASKPEPKPGRTWATETSPAPLPVPVDDESWSEFGGWYRKDHAVLYRPTGHRDRVIRTWLEVSAVGSGTESDVLMKPVFELLSDKDAQGRCAKCHSMSKPSGEPQRLKWSSSTAHRSGNKFTVFAHTPHFPLLDDKGCLTCHQLDDAATSTSVRSTAAAPVRSSFKPIAKATCASCHGGGRASQDCSHCHAYHVTPAATPIVDTRLPASQGPAE